jgi:myosin heavy subunit
MQDSNNFLVEQLLLGNGRPSDYGYTKDSNSVIDGVDDAEEFKTLMVSMAF